MAHRNLRETQLTRDIGQRPLVPGKPISMHQNNGRRLDARRASRGQIAPRRCIIERKDNVAVRTDPLVDFDHALVEQRWKLDLAHEQLRPVLITDTQGIGETARDDEHGALALALEQRVGRHGRSHLDRVDRAGGNRRPRRKPQQRANAEHRGVRIASRILGQELAGSERSVGLAGNDVGKRAAAIDPELPHAKSVGCTRVREAPPRAL